MKLGNSSLNKVGQDMWIQNQQNIYLLKDDYGMIIHQLNKLKHLTDFELKKNNEPTYSYDKGYGVRKYPYKPKKWNLSYLDYSIEEYEYKLNDLKRLWENLTH